MRSRGTLLQLVDRLGEGDALDLLSVQGDHRAEGAVVGRVDRSDTEARGEHAVERRRGAAALEVAEDRDAGLETGSGLDLAGDDRADAAESLVVVAVHLGGRKVDRALDGLRPFGDDDDGGEATLRVPPDQVGAGLFDVEEFLGRDDDRGTAGQAGVDGDPADLAAHHLADDHSTV